MFDYEREAKKVPNTHSLTRDQKDAFEDRTYKNDNKDFQPIKEHFLEEPNFLMYQRDEPRLESALSLAE